MISPHHNGKHRSLFLSRKIFVKILEQAIFRRGAKETQVISCPEALEHGQEMKQTQDMWRGFGFNGEMDEPLLYTRNRTPV